MRRTPRFAALGCSLIVLTMSTRQAQGLLDDDDDDDDDDALVGGSSGPATAATEDGGFLSLFSNMPVTITAAVLFGFLLGWLVAALLLAYYSPHCLRSLRTSQQFPTDHVYELNVFGQRGGGQQAAVASQQQNPKRKISWMGVPQDDEGADDAEAAHAADDRRRIGSANSSNPYVIVASASDDSSGYDGGGVPSYMLTSYQQGAVPVEVQHSGEQLSRPHRGGGQKAEGQEALGGRFGDYRQAGDVEPLVHAALESRRRERDNEYPPAARVQAVAGRKASSPPGEMTQIMG